MNFSSFYASLWKFVSWISWLVSVCWDLEGFINVLCLGARDNRLTPQWKWMCVSLAADALSSLTPVFDALRFQTLSETLCRRSCLSALVGPDPAGRYCASLTLVRLERHTQAHAEMKSAGQRPDRISASLAEWWREPLARALMKHSLFLPSLSLTHLNMLLSFVVATKQDLKMKTLSFPF